MKLLVVGSGGREHALAWKLAQSPKVETVFVAPGNAGTSIEPKLKNLTLTAHADLIDFCKKEHIAFTVVGPEAPLAAGIVDDFRAEGLKAFGPTQYAAQLESSKDFAKAFMKKYGIPTAQYQTFENAEKAHEYVNQKGAPIVIKADGLAAGKGVVMATSQDHKRLLDDDCGPNTGGMGAYSPAPVVTSDVYERAMNEIILPTVNGMKAEGHKFTGFLYAGLMIDKTGAPYTVEFNCRFGDPETQPIMSRLNSDLVDLLEAAIDGKLNSTIAEWNPQTAVGVVLAAENYPDTPKKGDIITGLDEADRIGKVFHAGTALNENGKVVTNGGRVVCVVGLGDNVAAAKTKAYQAVQKISFDGMQYRKDIADKAINR